MPASRARIRACVLHATRFAAVLVDLVADYMGVVSVTREPRVHSFKELGLTPYLLCCLTSGHIITAVSTSHVLLRRTTQKLFRQAENVDYRLVTDGWWRPVVNGLAYMVGERHIGTWPESDITKYDFVHANQYLWTRERSTGLLQARAFAQVKTCTWRCPRPYDHAVVELGGSRLLSISNRRGRLELHLFEMEQAEPRQVYSAATREFVSWHLEFARGAAALVLQGPQKTLLLYTPACGQVDFRLITECGRQYDYECAPNVCIAGSLLAIMTARTLRFVCPVLRRTLRVFEASVGAEFHVMFQVGDRLVVLERTERVKFTVLKFNLLMMK